MENRIFNGGLKDSKEELEACKNRAMQAVDNRQVSVFFQPIVNVHACRLSGAEALSRGNCMGIYGNFADNSGSDDAGPPNILVAPSYMFEYARSTGQSAQLDSYCMKIAAETFLQNPFLPTLFLNVHPQTVIETVAAGDAKGGVIGMLRLILGEKSDLTQRICLEVDERGVADSTLKTFASMCKGEGLMVALDNVGGGNSNLQRVTSINPDLVKIDRALVSEIDRSPYRQEIFKSIVNLSKGIGASVVAQGTSNLEESVTALMLGADFLQGFYFSGPTTYERLKTLELAKPVKETAAGFKRYFEVNLQSQMEYRLSYIHKAQELIAKAQAVGAGDEGAWDALIVGFLAENSQVECVYLIDYCGVQLTQTYLSPYLKVGLGLFTPGVVGDMHQIKHYYYAVREGLEDPFLSDWYVSGATGHPCRTLSASFVGEDKIRRILCLDFVK